jgi:hypothetical protein
LQTMTNITLSDGQTVDAERIKHICLWQNPTRLQIDLKDEDKPSIAVRAETAADDFDKLDAVREKHKLSFGIRSQKS